jgi:transcriptional regulator with XRE-family HTH domain
MNNERVELGKLFERFRRARQLSQEELAFRCHINRKSMSNIETGKHLPSLETFCHLAINFDMNPSELFKEIEKSGLLYGIIERDDNPN